MPQTQTGNLDRFFTSFVQLFCCNTERQKVPRKAPRPESSQEVKIRIGFDGKDSLVDPRNMNIKTTFGSYAVLLDSDNRLVPLKCDGSFVEPLDTSKRYVVVLNTFGSNKSSWDSMRKGKHKHRHHSHSHSKKKSKRKSSSKLKLKENPSAKYMLIEQKSSSKGCDSPLPLMAREYPSEEEALVEKFASNFVTKDFGVSISAEHLISSY